MAYSIPASWELRNFPRGAMYHHAESGLYSRFQPMHPFTWPWLPYDNRGLRYFYNMESTFTLPPPWEEHMTHDLRAFFCHPQRNISSWHRPVGSAAPPWQGFECDGKVFYFNLDSSESSWHVPPYAAAAGQPSTIPNEGGRSPQPARGRSVWDDGRRAALVSFSNRELRSFLVERAVCVDGCLERADLFQLAEAWVEAQDQPPELQPPSLEETVQTVTGGRLFDLFRRAPIAHLVWQFSPLQGRNVCRGRAAHPLRSCNREGRELVNESAMLFSEAELAADVVQRWQAHASKVAQAAAAFRAQQFEHSRATFDMSRSMMLPSAPPGPPPGP